MALKSKLRKSPLVRFLLEPWGKAIVAVVLLGFTVGLGTFVHYYTKYARLIDAKLQTGPYANTSMLFAAPKLIMLGEPGSPAEVAAYLRRCNYGESRDSRMGTYYLRPDAIEIFPGPDSYFRQEREVIKFSNGKVSQIISLRDNTEGTQYYLEPELITNLFDRKREKRRIVHFSDIPQVVKNALLAAEDKRFFQHSGFDPIGIIRASLVDLRERRNAAGASTLTQQLAGSVFLDRSDRRWRRKIAEALMTMHLEQKLSKQQIFEYYANEIYLGRRGSFSIHGFGEAAQQYFGKDLSQIAKPEEAALLAGLIQGPSLYNPFHSPERAKARRNTVLGMMREDGFLSQDAYDKATAAPLTVATEGAESSDAPYFVDLVNDTLQSKFQDRDFQANSYRVYTTLDMDLQRDAVEAARVGMAEVDKQLKRRYRNYGASMPEAQCAVVVLDPYNGEVKALVGGRNYGLSQLNRALARRQPGSSFKPFVYTAAINTELGDNQTVFTPITHIIDEPTTFWYDNKPYEPNNFENKFFGTVTLRQALAQSLNVPTVKVAESVGYQKVADLARRAGLTGVKPTPAMALGSYEETPLDIAGAYTIFANQGIYSKPSFIERIVDQHGAPIYDNVPVHRTVLDPRVAYMMVDMLEEVLRSGTATGVRARGFTLPAAGKTGTDNDGWFAGFTSRLLCVVWVGFDDNRELKLEGAHSALPIWTEFMKHAHQHREYRNVTPFDPPDGIVSAEVDPQTGQLASIQCPERRTEVFIAGTQPLDFCRLHGGGATQVAGWDATQPPHAAPPAGAAPSNAAPSTTAQSIPITPAPAPAPEPKKDRKGFFSRIRDIFR